MNYIKAKFPNSKRSYTYRTEDSVKVGDTVVNATGAKLTVTDETVDMAWVEAYGPNKVAAVKKYVEPVETFDPVKADEAQSKYCNEKGYPHFAPKYHCYKCHQNIYSNGKRKIDGKEINGISVERAGKELITGCPYCSWSYCE